MRLRSSKPPPIRSTVDAATSTITMAPPNVFLDLRPAEACPRFRPEFRSSLQSWRAGAAPKLRPAAREIRNVKAITWPSTVAGGRLIPDLEEYAAKSLVNQTVSTNPTAPPERQSIRTT